MTSMPLVLDALEDLLAEALAHAALDGTRIPVAQGDFKNPPRERVEIAEVQGTQTWADMAGGRDENYTVKVWVDIDDPRYSTQREAKNRAFAIHALVVAAVNKSTFDVGGDVSVLNVVPNLVKGTGAPAENGWAYSIETDIAVHAMF